MSKQRHDSCTAGYHTVTDSVSSPEVQVAVRLQGALIDPKTTLGHGVNMLKGGGGIFKSAAVAVLRVERKLMTTGDITKQALCPPMQRSI